MLNVRLNKDLEEKLKSYSERLNKSKSDIVKEALSLYFTKKEVAARPYDLGSDLFGEVSSGHSNKSVNYKKLIKQKLNEKYSH